MAALLRPWLLALFTLDFLCVPAAFAQQPELVIQTGHSMSVLSVAFSPDGKTLASGSADKTIKIWDVANGRAVRTLAGHADGIDSVVFSPEGHTLASVDDKDVGSGRELRMLSGQSVDVWSPLLGTLLLGGELVTPTGHGKAVRRSSSAGQIPKFDGLVPASGRQGVPFGT